MKSDLELNRETLRLLADSFTGENTQIFSLALAFMKLKFPEYIVKEPFVETDFEAHIEFIIPVINYLHVFNVPQKVEPKMQPGFLRVTFEHKDVSLTSNRHMDEFRIYFENVCMLQEFL